ncbi:helix-turn-helix domain-containing protein [Pseudomonas sp. GV071]|uniref:helix-turn-helix domain-containing protein n=1 Tax=Pseudomonas sp. GV071 TaxID=2135754 RepID=UPI000D3D7C7F|nr:helix-turn-helix domain-containing protein [Pseudomonas sp. GV071]PTQ67880.1 transcriptional regulator [Pseudomonas sp. GV071]
MAQKNRVIAAVYGKENDAGRVVGQSLKSLREAVGYTQLQMAERLGIGQGAVSKIEARGDVQISSLTKYVEALGASLRIEAAFNKDSEISARLYDELNLDQHSNRQLVLPIFSSDELALGTTKDFIISIHPTYSEKILEGKKTVELRRRFPISTARGTKIYIYSTSPVRAIVGCAEISDIIKLPIKNIWEKYSKSAFIKKKDFEAYFQGLTEGYALELKNAQTFETPINLKELRERFNFTPPQSFIYAKQEVRRALMDEQTNISN